MVVLWTLQQCGDSAYELMMLLLLLHGAHKPIVQTLKLHAIANRQYNFIALSISKTREKNAGVKYHKLSKTTYIVSVKYIASIQTKLIVLQ